MATLSACWDSRLSALKTDVGDRWTKTVKQIHDSTGFLRNN